MVFTPDDRQRRRLRPRWLLRGAALMFGLLLAEALLRMLGLPADSGDFLSVDFGTGSYVRDPERFWRLAPQGSGYRANNLGLRGFLPGRPKLRGEWRLLCVGDSSTFGFGVACEDAYGMQLAERIQSEAPDKIVRSVLFALPGYSSFQNRMLVERHIEGVDPDLVVLCCGAWNDYVPALELSDAEYAAQRSALRTGSSIGRLIARLLESSRAPVDRESVRKSFLAGEPPKGRRVPLAMFRENVAAMVQASRSRGSEVVVLVPPLPKTTIDKHPVALEYRRALLEVAAAMAVAVCDGGAAFDAFLLDCPTEWAKNAEGESSLFLDWTHPSALGHRVLADGLYKHLQRRGLVPKGGAGVASPADGLKVHVGAPLAAMRGGEVEITGAAIDSVAAEDVRVGRHWIEDVEWSPERLKLTLPATVETGRHALSIGTAHGRFELPGAIEVQPPPFDFSVRIEGAEVVLSCRLSGPPGWMAGVWFADKQREQSVPTHAGPFWLSAEPDGRPLGRDDLPFRFDRLRLPAYFERIGEDGTCRIEHRLPLAAIKDAVAIYAQGGISDGSVHANGAMTAVLRRPIVR